VMLGVAASFGMKKWSASARGRVAKNARIKVLTQHHLGPKKSLMIVEVAGESMLIGVTDSNISMLKSLSLIDDEIPEQLPHSFENAIEQNFIESENHAKPRLKESRAQRTLAAASSLETALEDHDEGENFALHGLSEIRDKVSTRLKNMRPL
jgi:flagellar protein FliO/FliZ